MIKGECESERKEEGEDENWGENDEKRPEKVEKRGKESSAGSEKALTSHKR